MLLQARKRKKDDLEIAVQFDYLQANDNVVSRKEFKEIDDIKEED